MADGLTGIDIKLNSQSYGPAFNAMISESIPKENRGAGFGAYRMFTSIPQIFMPVVSGYYFDMLGLGKAVRYGLLMFTVAMGIITVTRHLVIKETLVNKAWPLIVGLIVAILLDPLPLLWG